MAAYERVTLNRGGRNSRFDCIFPRNRQIMVYIYTAVSDTYLYKVPIT